MPSWVIGFLLGLTLIIDSLFLGQPLAFLNGVLGVFLWIVVLVNYYDRR